MTATSIPTRDQIAPQFTWNAESIFATPEDWTAAADAFPQQIEAVAAYQGKLSAGAATLKAFMEVFEAADVQLGKINVYASMSASTDSLTQANLAMYGRASSLVGRFYAAAAFVQPELLAIGRATLDTWLHAEPALQPYAHYLDNLFRVQQHVRSAEVEQILGLAADPLNQSFATYSAITDTDLKFADATDSAGSTHPVTQGVFMAHYSQGDRTLRRTAYESFMDGHLAMKNTLASNLLAAVKRDVFLVRVRGFETSLDASLFQSNLPTSVFHNLVNTFKKNLSTWHRYWEIKRRILKQDDIQPFDIWAPLTSETPVVPYEQAVDWISEGMRPLGDAYVEALRRGCLQDRWVDVYPNQGKRQGAFSSGGYGMHPFIMMSYNDNMLSMSTLAHELGHSLHTYHTIRHQPPVYAEYTMFVAEVASNFNQAMTRAYLREAKKDDAVFQINLIEEAMSNFFRYFFIMPTLARFELELHTRVEQGKGVTADDMINLMADLLAEGYGSGMTFDRQRAGITWATFLHLYANFYVFQYATGISAAHALSARILASESGAAERYLNFLKAGNSLYPLDALKLAGVDMTTPEAVETTFGIMGDMIEQLGKLAGV